MKRILSIVALLLAGSFGLVSAQDVVVADSTNVEVAQEVEDEIEDSDSEAESDSLDVAAADSLTAVLGDEIEKVMEKPVRGIYGSGLAKKWELQTELVYNSSFDPDPIKDGDDSGGLQFTLGYNINEHFLLGATLGYIHDFGGVTSFEGGDGVPVLGTLQYRWNTFPRLQFYVEGRAGIMMSIKPDFKYLKWGENKEVLHETLKYPSYLYCEVNPGIMFHMSDRYDVKFSAGYAYAKPINEQEEYKYNTYEEHILTFKLGIARRLGK